MTDDSVIAATRTWLERAVIGLNLCPFAKAVHVKEQIRYVVSAATTPEELLADLVRELEVLAEASPEKIDTTLLMHPQVLGDFLDYNDFLDLADGALEELQLDGILQIASFHPDYQFDGTEFDDVGNFSNRSPYPTLHLIREDSIEQAVAAFPDAAGYLRTQHRDAEQARCGGLEEAVRGLKTASAASQMAICGVVAADEIAQIVELERPGF